MHASRDSLLAALTTALLMPLGHAAETPAPAAAARPAATTVLPAAKEVIDFWKAAGPALWFAKDAAFDRRFRERFALLHADAARGSLNDWVETPGGALALLILLDQYPRNAFRNTPRMYATDELALSIARRAVTLRHYEQVEPRLRTFFILPFAHSERLPDQEEAVAIARVLGPEDLRQAEHHRDIVRRFGRFPHRNVILGRASTAAEQHYLQNGGYQG